MLNRHLKSVHWRVAKCLSFIEEARCLKVNSPLYRRGGAEEKTSPHFSVSVKPWRHSGTPIWVPFSWTQRMLEVYVAGGGGIWNLVKEHGCHDPDIRSRDTKGVSKSPRCIGTEGPNPFTILFYFSLFFTALIFFIHVLAYA